MVWFACGDVGGNNPDTKWDISNLGTSTSSNIPTVFSIILRRFMSAIEKIFYTVEQRKELCLMC